MSKRKIKRALAYYKKNDYDKITAVESFMNELEADGSDTALGITYQYVMGIANEFRGWD